MFTGYINQLQIAIFNSSVSLQEGKYRDVPLPGEIGVCSVAFPLGAQSVPGDDATCCEVKGPGGPRFREGAAQQFSTAQ